ncbi:stromal membrane-associated protein [Entomortierella parvispora]|uniref:Stromal membrane-associated protein n=1 Tax=Entomortierella parvispora TaxID=205924 RepID=A0A9P3LWB5_9FUNG|nr:stromal membrane-associated protein [Entomortierella parvispora]
MSTRFARTADKTSNDKHTRILKALLQKPGNKYCVDCRKKDPRWASFNLGCFMCIRCSGVHRSMGTHISKVKSVDLDSWTVDQVENMIKWGNEKANMYWEARLPENSIPNENTSGIDPWIRTKYEHKQFARKGPFPDPSELGPIDEAMLMDLYGKTETHSRPTAHMSRSSESSGSFTGMIAPPPSNPTRSTFPKKPTSSGVQGADLFSIGQPASSKPAAPAQEDFFGLNDPAPAPTPAAQKPAAKPAQTTATQDLFAMTTPVASSPANGSQAAPAKPAGNADWKSSILSLYGNQSSSPRPNQNQASFGMGQPQQQQPSAQFGQLQGMSAFGFGQAPAHQSPTFQPQVPQQQQQQPQNPWGNDDGFGAMQSGPSSSTFDSFASGSNNNGFGTGAPANNNNRNSNGMPQGGDFFNMIAGAARSPTSPPQSSNKNNSAFGDLSWN